MQVPEIRLLGITASAFLAPALRGSTQYLGSPSVGPNVDTGEPREPTGGENPGTPREGSLGPTRSPPRGVKWAPCDLGLAQTRFTAGAG